AAASEAASIFRGVAGMIIANTRMTIVFHERWPARRATGSPDTLHIATAKAFTSMKTRPAFAFVAARCSTNRTYSADTTENTIAPTSIRRIDVVTIGPPTV